MKKLKFVNNVVVVLLLVVFWELNHTVAPLIQLHCHETVSFWAGHWTWSLPFVYDCLVLGTYALIAALFLANELME